MGVRCETPKDDEPLPVVNCTGWNNLYGNSNVSRATLTNSIVWSVTDMGTHSAVNSFWRNGTVANQTGCISGSDTGLTLPGQATEKDVFDNPRVKYGIVDMGALECIQSLGTYFLVR